MPPKAVNDFTIPDLLRMLDEKLHMECAMLRGNPVSTASLQEEIDSLETKAYEFLRLISTLQNTLQPVNRLPPEIFSRIAQESALANKAVDATSIIPLAHVCRYWRNSIVSAPENWTLISSKSRGLMELSLERSKEAPLRLSLDKVQLRRIPRFMDHVTPHIHKIESLEFVNLATVRNLEKAFPNLPMTMPKLRVLSLSHSGTPPNWGRPSTDPSGSLSSTLTHLSLHNIPLYPPFLNIRTLTEFTLRNNEFELPLDTLLTFLEENRSLERVFLEISFPGPSLVDSQRQTPIVNQLQHLSVIYTFAEDAEALISRIPLRRGANLEIECRGEGEQLDELLSSTSTTHLGNLESPTYLESGETSVRISGPNGRLSFVSSFKVGLPFSSLTLDSIREFRIVYPKERGSTTCQREFHPKALSPFLEALAIEYDPDVSPTLSWWFADPESSPSLKTLAFLDCDLSEDFMKELRCFVSSRKDTASAPLYRVIIVSSSGKFPKAASIRALGRQVAVVEVRFGTELPKNLV